MGITVRTTPKSRISINNGGTKKLIVNTGGADNIDTIAELRDVDASDADTDETLVFDSVTQKYVVKTIPRIDGGSY